MTSIPVAMCRICSNKFKPHFLKQKWLFPDFSLHFIYARKMSNHFEKMHEYPSLFISEIIESVRVGYLNV